MDLKTTKSLTLAMAALALPVLAACSTPATNGTLERDASVTVQSASLVNACHDNLDDLRKNNEKLTQNQKEAADAIKQLDAGNAHLSTDELTDARQRLRSLINASTQSDLTVNDCDSEQGRNRVRSANNYARRINTELGRALADFRASAVDAKNECSLNLGRINAIKPTFDVATDKLADHIWDLGGKTDDPKRPLTTEATKQLTANEELGGAIVDIERHAATACLAIQGDLSQKLEQLQQQLTATQKLNARLDGSEGKAEADRAFTPESQKK